MANAKLEKLVSKWRAWARDSDHCGYADCYLQCADQLEELITPKPKDKHGMRQVRRRVPKKA